MMPLFVNCLLTTYCNILLDVCRPTQVAEMKAQTSEGSVQLYTSMDMACVNAYDEEHIYEAPKEVEPYEVPKVEAIPKKPSDYGHYYEAAAATD